MLADLANEVRNEEPPDNFQVLSDAPQAWQEFKEASKKENMVVCIEFVTQDESRSNLFIRLARQFEDIPFLRIIGELDSFPNVSYHIYSLPA